MAALAPLASTVYETDVEPLRLAIEKAFELKVRVEVLKVPSGAVTDWRILSVPAKMLRRVEDFLLGWHAHRNAENARLDAEFKARHEARMQEDHRGHRGSCGTVVCRAQEDE